MPHAAHTLPPLQISNNPRCFSSLCTKSKAVEAEEPEAEEQETELVFLLSPRRSHPAQPWRDL